MIKKLKPSFKKAAAIGLTSLSLLSNANSQLPLPSQLLPPRITPLTSQIALPLNEIEGERIIRSYLKRKNIVFKTNRLFNFRTREGLFYIEADFQLLNNSIIEYWGLEDEQLTEFKKRDYTIFKQELNITAEDIMRRWWLTEWQKQNLFSLYLNQRGILYRNELSSTSKASIETKSEKALSKNTETITITIFPVNYIILKPPIFLDKKDLYKKYEEIGGNIYYIETKNNASSIKQELEKIIEEATKNIILTEKQTKNIIALYFTEKKINYKENVNFKTSNIIISPDFLIETDKRELPIAIEYYSQAEKRDQKRKESVYEKYKQIGGKVYTISPNTKEELLSELEKIVNKILPSPLAPKPIKEDSK